MKNKKNIKKVQANKPKNNAKISPKTPKKEAKKPVKKTAPQKASKKVPTKKIPERKILDKKTPAKKVVNKKQSAPKSAKKPVAKISKPEVKNKNIKNAKITKAEPQKINKQKAIEPTKQSAKPIVEVKKPLELNPEIKKNNPTKTHSKKTENFSINSYVVYPSHGVGKIINIETTAIMQQNISCYMIYFEKERLTVKIPVHSADKFGIRALASKQQMDEVFSILRSGVKKMKGMWSRRAQEYETKINSGDIIMLAEVIRDLTRDIEDSERSYSERIIYETAIFRLSCEYAAIYKISFEEARQKVLIIAKDKLDSETKQTSKDDNFDDFDKVKSGCDDEEFEEDEEEEDEEEEDDFNYEYNEDDDFDDEDDDKPKKKKK